MGFLDIFKADVEVKCYDLDELAKLLDWYRAQYFSKMADKEFPVVAVTNGIFDAFENQPKINYFIVRIPYINYKDLREKFIESEVFDPILKQQAIDKVIGRSL